MSDIFLSYSSKDRHWAKLLAECLEKQGWSVWWDRTIPAGKIFTKVISEALSNARSVVVIWSRESVDSSWVQEEASEGRDRGILVPVLKENTKPPMGFRSFQAADLSGWDGNLESAEFKKLVEDLVSILGPAKQAAKEVEPITSMAYPLQPDREDLQSTISKTEASKPEVTEPQFTEAPPPTLETFPTEPEPIKPTTLESKAEEPESIEPKPTKPPPPEDAGVEPEPIEPKPVEPRKPKPLEVTRKNWAILIGVPAGLAILLLMVGLWWFVGGGKLPRQVAVMPKPSEAPQVAVTPPKPSEAKPEFPRRWRVEWLFNNFLYTGSLSIDNKINDQKYTGVLLIKTPNNRISQDALITINNTKVNIKCSNPSVKTYPADNFFLNLSENTMKGIDRDVKGNIARGVIFTAEQK